VRTTVDLDIELVDELARRAKLPSRKAVVDAALVALKEKLACEFLADHGFGAGPEATVAPRRRF